MHSSMKRSVLALLLLGISPFFAFAQSSDTDAHLLPALDEEDPIEEMLDSMLMHYQYEITSSSTYDTLLLNTQQYRSNAVPTFSQDVVRDRLTTIPAVIPMDHNQYVQAYINMYTQRKRDLVSRMLGLQHVYFPIFEEELDRMGMPMELKYLSIVESALNPHARSRVGATGLWQFMYGTAKQYGLRVNSFVDERKDPYKATKAAVKYLKDAHNMFGDWLLAIASYNCGAGNVRKAIIRSGGKKNFWAIRPYLPRETSGYVPAFIAAAYTFEYASEHNLYPVYVDFSLTQDSLHIKQMDITLEEISGLTNTSLEELETMNPELKLGRIPYSEEPYVLRVPHEVATYFAANEEVLREKFGKARKEGKTDGVIYSTFTSYEKPSGKRQTYVVQSGDVVGGIAERFGVSAREIARWNNLRRYRIKVGQRLVIYSDKQPASTPRVQKAVATAQIAPSSGAPLFHTVAKGETLWSIANQHSDVSVSHIQALNPGVNASNLKIGQRLRLR